MRREARMLAAIADTRVPHPRLVAMCDDPAVSDRCCYLMDAVDGFNPLNGIPLSHHRPIVQHRMGLALIEALIELHALDPSALGLDDFGKPAGFLDRQVARWRRQLDAYAEFSGWPGAAGLGDISSVADWLEAERPANFSPGILHGDFHLANAIFRNDAPEVAALVDWELCTIGDPLVDLGWLLATWPSEDDHGLADIRPWNGFPSAAALVEHYRERTTRSLDRIDWYAVLGCYKMAVILEGSYARACAGQLEVALGEQLHERARWLIARAQRWILAGGLDLGTAPLDLGDNP